MVKPIPAGNNPTAKACIRQGRSFIFALNINLCHCRSGCRCTTWRSCWSTDHDAQGAAADCALVMQSCSLSMDDSASKASATVAPSQIRRSLSKMLFRRQPVTSNALQCCRLASIQGRRTVVMCKHKASQLHVLCAAQRRSAQMICAGDWMWPDDGHKPDTPSIDTSMDWIWSAAISSSCRAVWNGQRHLLQQQPIRSVMSRQKNFKLNFKLRQCGMAWILHSGLPVCGI